MRIASGVTDQVIYFVALDATDLKTRETGLSSFTVYRSRNGGSATAFTTPTVSEVDSTNMPGVYKLLLNEDMTIDSGDETQEMVFHITHAGMAPVTRTIELYRPKITAGVTLTVESDGMAHADVKEWKGSTPANLTDTDKVSVSLQHVGSVTVPANMTQINGSSSAAANLAASASVIHAGAAGSGSSASAIVDSTLTSVEEDNYTGRIVIFRTGDLALQARVIEAFDPDTDTLTLTEAFTDAPGEGDTYVIL